MIGSYLHRYAYPDFYKLHVDQNKRELKNWIRGKPFVDGLKGGEEDSFEEFSNFHHKTDGAARCLQLRGEYMFVAEGRLPRVRRRQRRQQRHLAARDHRAVLAARP